MVNRIPTLTGKLRKMGRHFPVRKSHKILEISGKVRQMLFIYLMMNYILFT